MLDWGAVEAEFDRRIALEQEAKAKGKGEAYPTPGASVVRGAAIESVPVAPMEAAQPDPMASIGETLGEGGDAVGYGSVEVSSNDDVNVDSSPKKAANV